LDIKVEIESLKFKILKCNNHRYLFQLPIIVIPRIHILVDMHDKNNNSLHIWLIHYSNILQYIMNRYENENRSLVHVKVPIIRKITTTYNVKFISIFNHV
jgi:hypothetical protein